MKILMRTIETKVIYGVITQPIIHGSVMSSLIGHHLTDWCHGVVKG